MTFHFVGAGPGVQSRDQYGLRKGSQYGLAIK